MYSSQPFTLARLSLLILICSHAATAQYRLESWTNDNGLPQNTVRSITQTRDGYLWLTTFDGLVRFDGVQFKVFNTNNTKGLTSTRFTALYEDHDGTLWIGTNDGGLTLYRDGVFTSYTTKDGLPTQRGFASKVGIALGPGQYSYVASQIQHPKHSEALTIL